MADWKSYHGYWYEVQVRSYREWSVYVYDEMQRTVHRDVSLDSKEHAEELAERWIDEEG